MQNFTAKNTRGVPVRMFSEEKHARAWVEDHAHEHDGLHLVLTEIVERVVYRPRTQQAFEPMAIPRRGDPVEPPFGCRS